MNTEAYTQGQTAFRNGKSLDDNPYLGEASKAGIRRYTDEDKGTSWAIGFRDVKGAEYLRKNGAIPQCSDFVKRYRRR